MTTDRLALEQLTPEMVAAFGAQPVLIWSGEHRAWWRAGRAGYTTVRQNAGRYTLADAYRSTKHCGPEKCIHFDKAGAA